MQLFDNILPKISKPARYTGGEWNSIVKGWDSTPIKVALAFPDIYEVGMSNMAIPILYDLLNNLPDVLAERVYSPWIDMEAKLREHDLPLASLETRHPLNQFDIIGFSLGYELCYTTVLNMLDLAHIPVYSRDRQNHYPLIIAGGSCTMNPEPMADFIDAFFIGEAEQSLSSVISTYAKYGANRDDLLKRLCTLPGLYVPKYYTPFYGADGTISAFKANNNFAPQSVQRLTASSIQPVTKPVVPYIEVIHDRAAVEIQRGCSRGCRFCQAGILYRPVRELPETLALQAVNCILENCGYNSLSLVSLSSGDYSTIDHLIQRIVEKHSDKGISISLPSLRLDKTSIDLIESLPSGRKTTLTFAPEAGSERMRRVINKWIPQDAMMDTFAAAFQKNWMNLKLYFMIGLPTETLEDVAEIAQLVDSICKLGKGLRGRPPRIRVSVSSFVPKPHTPCQWASQDNKESLLEKQTLLKRSMKHGNVQLSWTDTNTSLLEAALSRGDRRLGSVIFTAWKKGCRLDAWNELHDFGKWQQAFTECGVDPAFYANRPRSLEEILPWQHIQCGVSHGFLRIEQAKMTSGDLTGDCRGSDCNLCGFQSQFPSCREKAKGLADKPVI
jgi:radical SAM family uncharacterized protein